METGGSKFFAIVAGALVIGALAGYSIKGKVSSPQPQSQTTSPTPLETSAQSGTTEWKIQNAMSAAIPAISTDATVLDWPQTEGAQLAELRKGTNDWTCLPDYPGSPGNDPICADKSAVQWFVAYMTQKEPKLTQVGLAYMLQGASDASNTDPFATEPAAGEDWVTAPAHVMVFPVGKLDPSMYGTDYTSGKSWIMYAGTPYEHLMIPVQ